MRQISLPAGLLAAFLFAVPASAGVYNPLGETTNDQGDLISFGIYEQSGFFPTQWAGFGNEDQVLVLDPFFDLQTVAVDILEFGGGFGLAWSQSFAGQITVAVEPLGRITGQPVIKRFETNVSGLNEVPTAFGEIFYQGGDPFVWIETPTNPFASSFKIADINPTPVPIPGSAVLMLTALVLLRRLRS